MQRGGKSRNPSIVMPTSWEKNVPEPEFSPVSSRACIAEPGAPALPPRPRGRAEAATAGRLDDKHVTRAKLGLVGTAQVRACPVGVLDPVPTALPRQTSRHTVRRNAAVAREYRCSHVLEEPNAPGAPGSATPAPCTARAATDLVAFQQDGEAPLEHFRIGKPGIGHVGLHDIGAVESRERRAIGRELQPAGARAAGDRLVVLVLLVPECEI